MFRRKPRDNGRAKRGRNGFTLIELMIAVTLLAIITGIVYASFDGVISSTDTAREAVGELQERRFLARNMQTNLGRAYAGWLPGAMHRAYSNQENGEMVSRPVDAEPIHWFVGKNGNGPFGPADTLSFATSAPLIGHTALPGHVKLVTMEVVELGKLQTDEGEPIANPEEARDTVLHVREIPIMGYGSGISSANAARVDEDFHLKQAERAEVDTPRWTIAMRAMDIRYYDGEEWRDEWDTEDEERLPWAVEINFEFPSKTETDEFQLDPDLANERKFRLVIALPAGKGIRNKTPVYGRPAGSIGTVEAGT